MFHRFVFGFDNNIYYETREKVCSNAISLWWLAAYAVLLLVLFSIKSTSWLSYLRFIFIEIHKNLSFPNKCMWEKSSRHAPNSITISGGCWKMCCKDNHSSLGGSRFGFGVSVLMTGVVCRHVEESSFKNS